MSRACGWCSGQGASSWVYDPDGSATALESYLPEELDDLPAGSVIVEDEECEECGGSGNEYVNPETGKVHLVDSIIAYEDGTLPLRDTVLLFQELIRSGQAWTLQGSYGRAASAFIEAGFITHDGEIDWDLINERIEA